MDADADGRLDLAVPCRGSDAVAVLIARPPGPPAFSAAVRYTVGSQPAAAVAVDLDGVNGLDLAVANRRTRRCRSSSTTARDRSRRSASRGRCGAGRAPSWPATSTGTGSRTWRVSSNVTNEVSVLRGTGGGNFAAVAWFAAGSGPDGLVAADVDGDGDLDLLVCNRVSSGTVAFLRNTSTVGAISFVPADSLRRRAGPHVHLRRPPGRRLHARLRRRQLHGRDAHRPPRRRHRGLRRRHAGDPQPDGRRHQPHLGHREPTSTGTATSTWPPPSSSEAR